MKKILPLAVLTALVGISTVIQAKPTEYIRDYDYHATRYDSEYTSRINAIDGAKQELLNEIGTHISSVIRVSKDGTGKSFFEQDTVMLTAGIISMKVLEELWENQIYYIKANMKVDPDEVKQSLQQLRQDQKLENQLRNSINELNSARQQINDLRAQLQQIQDPDNIASLARSYQDTARNIEVEQAFQDAIRARQQGNFNEAFVKLHELAEQNYGKAQQKLGFMFERGMAVEQDYEKARDWYLKASKNGAAGAFAQLGFLYERGLGVSSDVDKAVQLYQQAIADGSDRAYAYLGYLYQIGSGVEKNPQTAFELYSQGVERNHPLAIGRLAFFYQKGIVVDQDLGKALQLYRQAAKRKQPMSMAKLGRMYLKGIGVEKDQQLAAELILEAARYNSPVGLAYKGFLFEKGITLDQDHKQALQWYQKAAAMGNGFAEFRLGVMYLKGRGVKRDPAKALRLLKNAEAKGILKAGEIAQRVSSRMNRNRMF